ncbi:hypothetical protein ACIBCN_19825 [Nocardia sp. NPDC051052]|uniref:hypothetical protein n=1 Tax=Nocardia sp. NPDC051052 TaxID=3364322 RepID=UPI0037B09D21
MGTFEELRQRVLLQAGRAGYGIRRQHRAPYARELFTVSERGPVTTGTLPQLENYLAELHANTISDRQSR